MVKKIVLMVAFMLSTSVFTGVSTLSAQVSFESGSPEKLFEMADNEGKLVFMDLYASWCPPCKTMERDVFSRSDVGDFMSTRFVSVKYNVDEQMGQQLSREYNVRSIPTYLVFDEEGELVGRMMGAMSPSEFMANMQSFIDAESKK